MESTQQIQSKKRTLNMVGTHELGWKFRSKQDIIVYLDQQ